MKVFLEKRFWIFREKGWGANIPIRKPFKQPLNELFRAYPYFWSKKTFGTILGAFKAILEGDKEKTREVVQTCTSQKAKIYRLISQKTAFWMDLVSPKMAVTSKLGGMPWETE